jgi:hypothetical protein
MAMVSPSDVREHQRKMLQEKIDHWETMIDMALMRLGVDWDGSFSVKDIPPRIRPILLEMYRAEGWAVSYEASDVDGSHVEFVFSEPK